MSKSTMASLAAVLALAATTGAETVLLTPESDNWISSCSSGCTVNNGSMNELRVRTSWWGGGGNYEPKNFRPLLQFDLSSVPPDPDLLTGAVLSLYYFDKPHNDPVGRQYDVHRITNAWEETESTWQARDDYDSGSPIYWDSYLGGEPAYQPGGGDFDLQICASALVPAEVDEWMNWDVTSLVHDWLSGEPNHGLIIRDADEIESDPGGTVSFHARFRSREYSTSDLWPQLEVTYIPEPASAFLLGLGLVVLSAGRR